MINSPSSVGIANAFQERGASVNLTWGKWSAVHINACRALWVLDPLAFPSQSGSLCREFSML